MNCALSRFFACTIIQILTASTLSALEFRTADGSNNNLAAPNQGQAKTPLVRIRDVIANPLPEFDPIPLAPTYEDGIDVPRGIIAAAPFNVGTSRLPNPRDLSNQVVAQGNLSILNPLGASDWLWQWGQFIDHDLALEEPTLASEPFLIPVDDPSDSLFNPSFPFLPFRRNDPAPGTGAGTSVPREQVNSITAYIDGSNVYGSDQERSGYLRTFENGRLKTTLADNGEILPPRNRVDNPFPNANPPVTPDSTPPTPEQLFLAGDVRANEQVGLTAVHTLFIREHNRITEELASLSNINQLVNDAGLNSSSAADVDEYLYQMSRKAVGAQIQAITYNEFLPILIGANSMPDYAGYDNTIDATLSNEFANAAYRVGHTLLSPQIQQVSPTGEHLGSIALRDAFFNPQFVQTNGVDAVLKGLSTQQAQDVDAFVIDEVRNFLFAEGNGGLDLAAVNIQRGRDHGLPSYNDVRRGLGLTPRSSFAEITSDAQVALNLSQAYDSIDDVDLWLGAISEDAFNGGLVGELLNTILVDQFTRTRDGDRFFYQNDVALLDLFPTISELRLSDIILQNTNIEVMPASAMLLVPEPTTLLLASLAICVTMLFQSRDLRL